MKSILPIKKSAGFTLIELLVALTIIAILAVAVFVALNPAQRIKDTRDAKRGTDVAQILSAIHTSIVDDKGTLPTNLNAMTNGTTQQLGTGNATDCVAAVNATHCGALTTVCVDLMTGTENLTNYLASMPIDPVGGTTANSVKAGYAVTKAASGIVTVTACHTDAAGATNTIKVSR